MKNLLCEQKKIKLSNKWQFVENKKIDFGAGLKNAVTSLLS
jgi:hypothetical protein